MDITKLSLENQTAYHRLMAIINRRGNVRTDMSPCWLTTNSLASTGYGQICINETRWNTHRLSWWLHNGCPDMTKKHVCHRCDNKECCNPDHLYLGTAKENAKDTWDRGLKVKKEPKEPTRNSEPCHNCVEHHKKCDGGFPCSFCQTSGAECVKKEWKSHGGTFKKGDCVGENNLNSKLKDKQIIEIRQRHPSFKYGEFKKYAEQLGVAYITCQKYVEKNKDGSYKKRPELIPFTQ